MKAAIFGGAGKPIAIESVPDPVPGRDQVVVKVGLCGICGTDMHMTEKHESGQAFLPPAGASLGHEFCGEVVALGAGVKRLTIGDRISAMPIVGCGVCAACLSGHPFACTQMQTLYGGFGEYALVNANFSVPLPKALSLVDGALVEPLAAALRGVKKSGMFPGAKVLVLGAGTMGLGTIFWARRLGAGKIVATARSRWREAFVLEMGANAFVENNDDLAANAAAILGGPPDIVFEAAGTPGMIAQAINLVRPGGTILIEGGCMHSEPIISFVGMCKEVCLQFSVAYTMDDFRFVVDTLDAGALEPRGMITATRSLDALPQTMELLRDGSHQCKVMIDPWMDA